MKRNMSSKPHEAAIAYPLLKAHFFSSLLHTEYTSGLFIIKTVATHCLDVLVGDEPCRHEKVFCDGEEGVEVGDGVEYAGKPVAGFIHRGNSASLEGIACGVEENAVQKCRKPYIQMGQLHSKKRRRQREESGQCEPHQAHNKKP